MYTTLDIGTDIVILLCGVAAIIYGYFRWSAHHENKDRWWYVIGLLFIAGVAWDYLSKNLLMIDHHTLFWSRNLVAVVVVVACIGIYKRFELE